MNTVGTTFLAPQMNVERLQKMAGVVRTGGKGTVRRQAALAWLCGGCCVAGADAGGPGPAGTAVVSLTSNSPPLCRRKKKAVHKTTSTDDKRLQSTLKRLGVNTIPGIEEVLLINNDGTALQFNNPKVQASIAANTYVVSGASQPKREWQGGPPLLGEGEERLVGGGGGQELGSGQVERHDCCWGRAAPPGAAACAAGVWHGRFAVSVVAMRAWFFSGGYWRGISSQRGQQLSSAAAPLVRRAGRIPNPLHAPLPLFPIRCPRCCPWLPAGAQDVMASMLAGMGGMAGLQQMMGGMGGAGMPAFNPEGAADEPDDDGGLWGQRGGGLLLPLGCSWHGRWHCYVASAGGTTCRQQRCGSQEGPSRMARTPCAAA